MNQNKIIEIRVGEIWTYICERSDLCMSDWFFENGDYDDDGNTIRGSFNEKRDKEFIKIGGGREYVQNRFYPYNDGFPTILLDDPNWKDTVNTAVKEAEEKNKEFLAQRKERRDTKAQRDADRKASIQSKIKPILTVEEWEWICNKLGWRAK